MQAGRQIKKAVPGSVKSKFKKKKKKRGFIRKNQEHTSNEQTQRNLNKIT